MSRRVPFATLHAGQTRVSLGHHRGPLALLENPPSTHQQRDPDDEWLVIHGKITCLAGDWAFREPCLMVDEYRALIDWFRDPVRSNISFIEPCLEFAREAAGEAVTLHTTFRGEAFPPWASRGDDEFETVWRQGHTLTFHVTQAELNRFADALEYLDYDRN